MVGEPYQTVRENADENSETTSPNPEENVVGVVGVLWETATCWLHALGAAGGAPGAPPPLLVVFYQTTAAVSQPLNTLAIPDGRLTS